MAAKVYFSREITPEKVLELYKMAGKELTGNIAIKLHSGEEGNQNFLKMCIRDRSAGNVPFRTQKVWQKQTAAD